MFLHTQIHAHTHTYARAGTHTHTHKCTNTFTQNTVSETPLFLKVPEPYLILGLHLQNCEQILIYIFHQPLDMHEY